MILFGEISFAIFILSVLAGYSLGVFSGLVPGIHTNNFALVLLALSPVMSDYGMPVFYIAVMILANSVSHSFHDIIPAIFLGAPSDDMALAVLPGHTLLLEGRGAEAIRLSALGSAGSVAFAAVLALPLSMLFKSAYGMIQSYLAWILITVVIVMILTEKGEFVPGQGSLSRWKFRFYALLVFFLSGSLGVIAFNTEYLMRPVVNLGEPSILLPLLSGLFGSSQLIISLMSAPVIPAQLGYRIDLERKRIFRGIFIGGLSGSLVAWLPGISSSVATVFARLFIRQEPGEEWEGYSKFEDPVSMLDPAKEFIVSVSGVNTCNAIFALVALAVIGKSRNGAMVVVDGLLGGIEPGTSVMILFLCAVSLTALLSYFSTIYIGDRVHNRLSDLNYPVLCYTVLAILSMIVVLFTGVYGIVIFAISTSVGMLAPFLKVRKSHAMGVILLPVILYFM